VEVPVDDGLDLLVVAEAGDELAAQLVGRARLAGRTVLHVGYREAARILCVTQDAETLVVPECPMLVRAPYAPPSGTPQREAFHQSEIRALVWAAAALTRSPVVNRPNADGFAGRVARSSAVVRLRAGLPPRQEIFASHASAALTDEPHDDWWFEHQGSYAGFGGGRPLNDRGPYRVGCSGSADDVMIACVVGSLVTVNPPGAEALVRDRSGAVATALDLQFATMVWRRGLDSDFELGRVNPYPTLLELGDRVDDVMAELLAMLKC
jgi:hypothetical protein